MHFLAGDRRTKAYHVILHTHTLVVPPKLHQQTSKRQARRYSPPIQLLAVYLLSLLVLSPMGTTPRALRMPAFHTTIVIFLTVMYGNLDTSGVLAWWDRSIISHALFRFPSFIRPQFSVLRKFTHHLSHHHKKQGMSSATHSQFGCAHQRQFKYETAWIYQPIQQTSAAYSPVT